MQTKEKKYFRNNLILILIFIFFFLSFSKIKSFFNSSTKDKNTPEVFLSSINNGIGNSSDFFSGIGGYFSSKKALLNQISDLQNQIEKQKYSSIVDSLSSSESLSSNFSTTSSHKSIISKNLPIVAKKIFSDFTSIYDTVLLDKGFSSGVQKGDIVFLYPNLIIGQIDSINPNTSLLTLYSRNKNKIEGIIKVSKNNSKTNFTDLKNQNSPTSTSSLSASSTSSIPIEVNFKQKNQTSVLIDLFGNGGGDFIAKLPNNLEVSIGTIIYLSNDENKALGEVVKVEIEETSFYENIFIKGYYNSRLNDSYYIMHK